MVIPAPDVISVLVDDVLLDIVPDAVGFDKPLMMLLFIATSGASDIIAILKPTIVAFAKLSIFIVLHCKWERSQVSNSV